MVKDISERIGVMYHGRVVVLAAADDLYRDPTNPYPQPLLSAIPLPDPHHARARVRKSYHPNSHQYGQDEEVKMREIAPGHFVNCSEAEFIQYQQQYKE